MEQKNNGKTFAIIALVLGILSVCFAYFEWINIGAVICGIVGIVLAVMAKNQLTAAGQPKGLAVAALVVSIVGLVDSVIGLFACTICVACVTASVADGSLENALNSLASELSALG